MSATLATEDVLIIETPEHVPLPFALASIRNCFIACTLDYGFQALTVILMFIALTVLANYPSIGEQPPNASTQHKSNQETTSEELARADLAAVLAERDQAAEKKDIERVLSYYTVDFAWRIGGRTLNRQETEQVLRLSTSGLTLENKQRSTIKSIKLRGKDAVVNVVYESFVKQQLRDGSIREDINSGEKREAWVKTDQGWKLRVLEITKSKESQTTINGRKVDPLKAPSSIEAPAPNIEDQSVLQDGDALLFVYRLNDGTIVKAPVYCNEVKLAEMTGGSFIKAKLRPGKHSFHSEKGPAIDINMESGKIYFLVLKLRAGFPKGRGELEVDINGVGPTAYKLPKLMELKPLGRDNISDNSRVIVAGP